MYNYTEFVIYSALKVFRVIIIVLFCIYIIVYLSMFMRPAVKRRLRHNIIFQ